MNAGNRANILHVNLVEFFALQQIHQRLEYLFLCRTERVFFCVSIDEIPIPTLSRFLSGKMKLTPTLLFFVSDTNSLNYTII